MKKFVGNVNGKSFDNEKDFNEAAQKAIQSKEENLSISSYYSYTNDDEEKQQDENNSENYLPANKYILYNQEPELVDKEYVYPVSEELHKMLMNASNDKDIVANVDNVLNLYKDQIREDECELKELESKIENLQSKLYDKETVIKKLYAKQNYYNLILNIISKKVENKGGIKDEAPANNNIDIRQFFGSTSLCETLRKLGLI